MNYTENTGSDPITLRQGYKKLPGDQDHIRDNQVPPSANLVETPNGGFLGRTESVDSESSKL